MPIDSLLVGEPDEYVYHYTTSDGLAGILHSGAFRMSRYRSLNDPRESKKFSYPTFTKDDIDLIERQLFECAYVTCFAMDIPDHNYEQNDVSHTARGYGRARNWDQYGERHRGACLIFDRERLESSFDSLLGKMRVRQASCSRGPVRYADRQPMIRPEVVQAFRSAGVQGLIEYVLDDGAREFYFTKNRDWESEREYRLLALGKGDESPYIEVRNALVGIVLGELYPNTEKPLLSHRLRRFDPDFDLSIGILEWMNGAPGCYVIEGDSSWVERGFVGFVDGRRGVKAAPS